MNKRRLIILAITSYVCIGLFVSALSLALSFNKNEIPVDVTMDGDGNVVGRQMLELTPCLDNSYCGSHGFCTENGYCDCLEPYISISTTSKYSNGEDTCNYKAKRKLNTFLFSFLLGEFGADWFYLCEGHGGCINSFLTNITIHRYCGRNI